MAITVTYAPPPDQPATVRLPSLLSSIILQGHKLGVSHLHSLSTLRAAIRSSTFAARSDTPPTSVSLKCIPLTLFQSLSMSPSSNSNTLH